MARSSAPPGCLRFGDAQTLTQNPPEWREIRRRIALRARSLRSRGLLGGESRIRTLGTLALRAQHRRTPAPLAKARRPMRCPAGKPSRLPGSTSRDRDTGRLMQRPQKPGGWAAQEVARATRFGVDVPLQKGTGFPARRQKFPCFRIQGTRRVGTPSRGRTENLAPPGRRFRANSLYFP